MQKHAFVRNGEEEKSGKGCKAIALSAQVWGMKLFWPKWTMNSNHAIVLAATLFSAASCFGADDRPSSPTLPILPPELASYEPRGGRNLAEQVRVNTITGDLFYWETDLAVAGSPLAPILQRFYRSRASNQETGLFGRGWRTILERKLVALDSNTYLLTDEWGMTWQFSKDKNGQWWAKQGAARWIELAPPGLILHDSDGLVWLFDSAGWLVGITDPSGQGLTVERDPVHPSIVRTIRNPWGASLSFDIDADGRIERVTSSEGQRASYEYRDGLLIGVAAGSSASSRYTYDKAARLTEIALGNGSLINLQFNEQGRITDLSGKGIVPRTYAYRERGQVDQTTLEVVRTGGLGDTTRWRVLSGGRRVEKIGESAVSAILENDDRGNPTQFTLADKTSWRWKYDGQGRVLTVQGPQDEPTRFTYSGNRLQPDRVERPDGSIVRFDYDQKGRRVAAAIERQRPRFWEYDKSGRLQKFEDYFHGRHEITYDEKGRIVSVGGPSETKILVGRDEKGRIVSVGQSGGPMVRFGRDSAGRVKSISDGTQWLRLELNDSGNVTGLVGSQGYMRRFYYTAEGILSTLQAPNRITHRLFYDRERNCVAFQRPDNTSLHLVRGPASQVRTLDAAGYARWTVDYDAWERPICYRKQGYPQVFLDYDGAGRLRKIEGPSEDRMTLDYAPNGNLALVATALRRFQFIFDPAGRLQALVESTSSRRDAFEYDETGRMVRRSSPGWTDQFRHDRAGRVTTWAVVDSLEREFGFQYSDAGCLETITYPNSTRSTFEYDSAHRLTRTNMRDREGRTLLSLAVDYATSSRLAAATGEGNDRVAYRYDPNLALIETAYSDSRRDIFSYDSGGNLSSVTSGSRRETFRRDALGRPTEVGTTRYIYLAPNVPLPPMTSSTTCLILDDRERITALHRGDGLKALYAYLPDGRMIRREIAGRVLWLDWDGPRLKSLHDEHGRVLTCIHYEPTFGLPLAVAMGRQVYFCHPDPFGHPTRLTDENGKMVEPPDDFPFDMTDPNAPPIGPTWEGLPPAIRLPEEGLYLVRGRLCDVRSGDFLSPDLPRFIQSLNPYRARVIPRPIEPTMAWEQLTQAIRWIERIERNRFEHRWQARRNDDDSLFALASLVRQPELFETHLLDVAFQHSLDPDQWLDPIMLEKTLPKTDLAPYGLLELPSSPADLFSDFSPLGPIPYNQSAFGLVTSKFAPMEW